MLPEDAPTPALRFTSREESIIDHTSVAVPHGAWGFTLPISAYHVNGPLIDAVLNSDAGRGLSRGQVMGMSSALCLDAALRYMLGHQQDHVAVTFYSHHLMPGQTHPVACRLVWPRRSADWAVVGASVAELAAEVDELEEAPRTKKADKVSWVALCVHGGRGV